MDLQILIDTLQLEAHREGGYFRRTYQADAQPRVNTPTGQRFSMTSIYYLLTEKSPIGHFHRNRSDIVHYYHLGDCLEYFLIDPQGQLTQVTLGTKLSEGEQLQLTVPGGWWKASRLCPGGSNGFGLISEAVSPGFDYSDSELGNTASLIKAYPAHAELLKSLTRD